MAEARITTVHVGSVSEFDPEKEEWVNYKKRLDIWMNANKIEDVDKVNVFLAKVGPVAFEVLVNLTSLDSVDTKSYDELTALCEKHYKVVRTTEGERVKFRNTRQKPGQSVTDFQLELRKNVRYCGYADPKEAMKETFLTNMGNKFVKAKVMQDCEGKDFETCVAKALQVEKIFQETKTYLEDSKPQPQAVNHVHRKQQRSAQKCHRCTGDHDSKTCRYKDDKCHVCGKQGHISRACWNANKSSKPRSKQPSQPRRKGRFKKKTHFVEEDGDEDSLYSVYATGVSPNSPIKVQLEINGKKVDFLVDTGANVSIIPVGLYQGKLAAVPLRRSNLRLKSYSGDLIPVIGEMDANVTYEGKTYQLPLVVAKGENVPLLGRNWLTHIKLNWSQIFAASSQPSQPPPSSKYSMKDPQALESLLDKYKEVFTPGQGTIKDFKAHIKVKPGTTPKFYKPRPVPYSMKEKVEKELDRLESNGIIKKVERSEWAAPIVVVPKADGSIRVCGDYKVTVNPYLEDETYPLPTAEDLFADLAGGKIWSKLDLSAAYLQLELAEDSKQYLTINTHKGLYQYQRLSFGVATAPLIFQRVMDQVLQGLEDVGCSQDDILIKSDEEEKNHLRVLESVLKRLSKYNIKAKLSKTELFRLMLRYLGHMVDEQGLHPEEEKVKAIADMPAPRDVKELQSLIGMINYYGKFLPFQANTMKPMYQLLKKETKWCWTDECQKSLDTVKKQLSSSPVLVHYDPRLPITVASDASPYGVGAILSHVMPNGEERPVAYASRTLNAAEKNYAQIEKEALALVYGVKKFHKYIYGRKFTLITDHKPLTTIFGPKSGVPTLAAQRLQRWALILMGHRYDIKYRKSGDHANADALSRLPLVNNDQDAMESPTYFFSYADKLPISSHDIAEETRKDPILSRVQEFVLNGWPEHCSDPEMMPYYRRRSELTMDQGCILWGIRVIIPPKYRARLLDELHEEHPGIVRMKSWARSYLFYPGIDADIETKVNSCGTCQAMRNNVPAAPLHPWKPSGQVWERIHMDFAELERIYYLIIVCSTTKWVEVEMMNNITSASTIKALRKRFAQFGIPEESVSDNGRQFTSDEFKRFLQINGIKQTLIPPYHPPSNGQAERTVETVKNALKKHMLDAKKSAPHASREERLDSFLLMYRTTPHATTGRSPAELFLKRRPKTRFDLLKPNLRLKIQQSQDIQKKYHDGESRKLREFTTGEIVRVKNVRDGVERYLKGVVAKRLGPLTYLVKVGLKCRYTHVDHLLKSGETQIAPEDYQDEDLGEPDGPDLAPVPPPTRHVPQSASADQPDLLPAGPATTQQTPRKSVPDVPVSRSNGSAATPRRTPYREQAPNPLPSPDRYPRRQRKAPDRLIESM